MSRFLKKQFENLVPYTPGEQPKNKGGIIKLNTNENPYPPAPSVQKVVDAAALNQMKLYSDPEAHELVAEIAKYYDVDDDMVMVGNGSDEILAFVFMAFQAESRKIYYPDISYSFYPVYCNIFDIEGIQIPLKDDFSIEASDYFNLDGNIIITNPNAPTGIDMGLTNIEKILKTNQKRLVIIDEAYVDFGGETAVYLTKKYDNLLIVQTFSKSRSLAGARIGFAIANREIIEDLNKIKYSFNPYNLNRLSISMGSAAIKDNEYFEETRNKIIDTREFCIEEFEKIGFSVLSSKTNFVFVTSDRIEAREYFEKLREYNIIVRYFNKEKLSNYVRITIGTKEHMDELIRVTKEILA